MTKNHRTIIFLAAALVVAGVVIRQEMEIYRLRTAIAHLTNIQSQRAEPIHTNINSFPADIEELRRDAAEVRQLRVEVAQLRSKIEATSALQASVEKLAREVSAISGNSSDRNGSIDFVDEFNRPSSKGAPLASQATALARSSPEEAARWVASLPAGKDQDQAALAVVDYWTGTNPVAAAVWTTQFPEGQLREQAMSLVARQWGLRDWNATADWLETLPMGSSRDAAIGAFVMSADGNNIQLALEWANRTEEAKSRAERVEGTARRWLREDNPAARAWIQNARLPEGMAERLLSAK